MVFICLITVIWFHSIYFHCTHWKFISLHSLNRPHIPPSRRKIEQIKSRWWHKVENGKKNQDYVHWVGEEKCTKNQQIWWSLEKLRFETLIRKKVCNMLSNNALHILNILSCFLSFFLSFVRCCFLPSFLQHHFHTPTIVCVCEYECKYECLYQLITIRAAYYSNKREWILSMCVCWNQSEKKQRETYKSYIVLLVYKH